MVGGTRTIPMTAARRDIQRTCIGIYGVLPAFLPLVEVRQRRQQTRILIRLLIQKLDGVALNNGQTLAGELELHEVGDTVTLSVLRGGSSQEIKVVLGARPPGA